MPELYRYDLPSRAGDQRQLGQLIGAACAVECAEIAERHHGPVMLIAQDMQNALRLQDEIQQFTDQPVMALADWETLPFDSFSPHQEIISSRLSTLYQLPTLASGILILPVNTLMQRVCPHNFLHGHALMMQKGQKLSRDKLRSQLEQAGYRSVDQVMAHGEFATRGALLDLYPMGSERPYRIDFLMMKSIACACSTSTASALRKRWRQSTCCRPTNSRLIKTPLSCSAASGVNTSTSGVRPSISISR
ncbi:transcription-repair coupling factor (superfamily II helicase) [Erwinia amylovora MR1]|nr:transcription-repair coupling factor (superfamily II helicase) [Erwinia amylovora MR1]